MAGLILVVSNFDERAVNDFCFSFLSSAEVQKLWEDLLGVFDVCHSKLFFFCKGFNGCYDAENGREYLSCTEISE